MQQQMRSMIQEEMRRYSPPRESPIAATPPGRSGAAAQPTREELVRDFYKAPLEMTATIAEMTAQNVLRNSGYEQTHETMIHTAREAARSEDPALFDKYFPEIEAQVKTLAPQFHTNINVWKAAANNVYGQHRRDIVDAARSASAPAVRVSSGSGPGAAGLPPEPSPPSVTLSEDERYIAKRLGLTDEQYRRGKAFVDKQEIRQPSSWDEYVTFSSKEKRRNERTKRTASSK
jgi:hypothetical protein